MAECFPEKFVLEWTDLPWSLGLGWSVKCIDTNIDGFDYDMHLTKYYLQHLNNGFMLFHKKFQILKIT